MRKVSAKDVLESIGIPYPEGASAFYDPESSELIVRNTRENLALVQVYVDQISVDPYPSKIAIRTEIYEVTPLQALQLQESAQAEADHKPERDAALRAVHDGKAKLVASHSLVTTSAQRAKIEDVATMAMLAPKVDEKTGAKIEEMVEHHYGTILEAEPNVGADGFTIMMNIALEHHTAEPELVPTPGGREKSKFHEKSIQTNVNLYTGGYVLLTTWKPTGKPEYANGESVHVVFVTASLQGQE